MYEETDFKPFDEFMKYLADSYPEVYRVMDADTINTYGMVIHWKGRNSDLKPILFLSHYVAQSKKMTELKSTYPPYFISKNKLTLSPDMHVDKILEGLKERYATENVTDIDGV